MKGVLDRFADHDLAVILIEDVQKEILVPIQQLPPNSKEGTWFDIKEDNGEYQIVAIDVDMTKKQMEKSLNLLKKLRANSRGSKFKRN